MLTTQGAGETQLRKKKAFLIGGMIVLPLSASASTVTYDYSGTIKDAIGIFADAGATFSGTFTIDTSTGNSNYGTLGSTTSAWSVTGLSGPEYNRPLMNLTVFNATFNSGGLQYSSGPTGSYGALSTVGGISRNYQSSDPPDEFLADVVQYPNINSFLADELTLVGATGADAPFDADGLPVFANATLGATGTLYSEMNGINNGELDYTIDAITLAPVPLPDAAWLMLCGLGGLAAFARKKRAT